MPASAWSTQNRCKPRRKVAWRPELLEQRQMLAPLLSGDEIAETIPRGGERDYEIVLAASERVLVRAGITSGSGEVDLQVLDPTGADITNRFLFPSSRINTAFTAEVSGEYTLRVGDEDRNETLPFRMRVVALPGLDTVFAGRDVNLTSGQSITATLTEHSFNVHRVNLAPGDWVRVSGRNASGSFPETYSAIDIEVYDPAGVRVASVTNLLQSLDFSAEASGEYSIIVSDEENLYELDYELRYVRLPGDFSEEPGSDGDLDTGQILSLEVPEGGFGVNRFDAPAAGETYRVHTSKRTGQGSTELAVIGPDGAVVASDFGFPGADATFVTTSPGPHGVVVWDDTNDDRMEYVIRLGKLSNAPLPYVADYDEPLTLGQEYFAEEGVFYSLFNLHPLVLEAGQTVDIAMFDFPSGFSTPTGELTIHAPDGSIVAAEAAFNRVETSFTATVAGAYLVVVAESGNNSEIRSYRLLAEEGAPPVMGDYTADGVVDQNDYHAWRAAYGATDGPALAADGNGDGIVDAGDYTVWRDHVTPHITGDYNGDGYVDTADYALWRNTYGESGQGLPADGDNNGVIDAADYTVWRDNLGARSPAPSSVPAEAKSTADTEPAEANPIDAGFALLMTNPAHGAFSAFSGREAPTSSTHTAQTSDEALLLNHTTKRLAISATANSTCTVSAFDAALSEMEATERVGVSMGVHWPAFASNPEEQSSLCCRPDRNQQERV